MKNGHIDVTIDVSIHAPAWGATMASPSYTCVLQCFNPRSRVGSDTDAEVAKTVADMFQSTLPRGERL